MRRGPAPTPTKILELRGSKRARRNPNEPKPDKGRPRCPLWLKGNAKAEWKKLVEMTDRMGILTKVDGNALARYCRLWQRWRRSEDFIEEHGDQYPVKDKKGNTIAGISVRIVSWNEHDHLIQIEQVVPPLL